MAEKLVSQQKGKKLPDIKALLPLGTKLLFHGMFNGNHLGAVI